MKKEGFTLVELCTVIIIISLLSAILVPLGHSLAEKFQKLEEQQKVEVVKIENGNLNLKVGIIYKIPLIPSFVSDGSASTISIKDPLAGMFIGVEDEGGASTVSYLYWTPQETRLSKMTIITQATRRDGSEMKEERVVEIFVH